MSDTELAPARDYHPIQGLVVRALSSRAPYHSTLVLYFRLLTDADAGAARRLQDYADLLGVGLSTVRRSVRALRLLGLLRGSTVTTYSGDHRVDSTLEWLESGKLVLDLAAGTLTTVKTGKLVDLSELDLNIARVSPMTRGATLGVIHDTQRVTHDTRSHNVSCMTLDAEGEVVDVSATTATASVVNEPKEGSERVMDDTLPENKKVSIVSIQGVEVLDTERGPKPMYLPDKLPLKSSGLAKAEFDPARDPFRPVLERVQAYANEKLGTRHDLLDALGKPRDRYRQLLRALVVYGYTEEQLRKAIDGVLVDAYWRETGVKDTGTLFKAESTIQSLLSPKASRPFQKADTRHVECAALPEGVVADSFEL